MTLPRLDGFLTHLHRGHDGSCETWPQSGPLATLAPNAARRERRQDGMVTNARARGKRLSAAMSSEITECL